MGLPLLGRLTFCVTIIRKAVGLIILQGRWVRKHDQEGEGEVQRAGQGGGGGAEAGQPCVGREERVKEQDVEVEQT